MTTLSTVQKTVSDFSFILGKGMMYGGGAGLFLMACVGTVAIDLVLLAYAEKHHDNFMTGFILGSIFWGPRIDPLPLLIASPITSIIAVGLSVALGVPTMGAAILAGWACSAALLALGYGALALSEAIHPEAEEEYRHSAACAF